MHARAQAPEPHLLSQLTGVSATQRTEAGDLAVSWRNSGSVDEQRYQLNVTVAPGLAVTTRLVLPSVDSGGSVSECGRLLWQDGEVAVGAEAEPLRARVGIDAAQRSVLEVRHGSGHYAFSWRGSL